MHSALIDVFARLDRSRDALRAAVQVIPPALREHIPAENRWSVAGVLEHLALVENRFASVLGTKIAEARANGAGQEVPAAELMSSSMEADLLDRTQRRTAPDAVHPTGLSAADAWQRTEAAREAFRAMLRDADGMALSQVIHQHPRLGALNVYQWGCFVAAHETRHAAQIAEIGKQLEAQKI